jgi:phosphoadenosine phosphosulfate reductase
VILDLLHRSGVLKNEAVKIVFVDTFHLFPETYVFLAEVEKRYGFKAHVFHADGFNNKEEYEAKHGSDLFITDIDEYDRICKVEPFNRALETLNVDAMINGRRRDHGAERAHLEVVEAGAMAKIQPIAYWEFRDVWNYLQKYSLPYHPLHDQGFPSIGDVQTTLPVPQDKWFEYGGERSGRFQVCFIQYFLIFNLRSLECSTWQETYMPIEWFGNALEHALKLVRWQHCAGSEECRWN